MVYLVMKTTKEGKMEFVSCWSTEIRVVKELDRLNYLPHSGRYWIKGIAVQD